MLDLDAAAIDSVIMRLYLALFLLLASLQVTLSKDIEHGLLLVNGAQAKAETDDNFICATIDWWPPESCNFGFCSWAHSSIVTLDLSRPLLAKAIQALKPLRIRLGGSLQDQVVYNVGNLKSPGHSFQKIKGGFLGFSEGSLHMQRWDELNHFFNKTGAIVMFGLNALSGRHKISNNSNVWEGAWDPTNAYDFIKYTVSKGYKIDAWEFGNELSGTGVGASVGVAQYGKDVINLKRILNVLYKNSKFKPSLVAPDGSYDKEWYNKLLQLSGPGIINVLTHHLYNLGRANDTHLIERILDPDKLSEVETTFRNLSETIQKHGPWASAWVGESGGISRSGSRDVSNTFVNSFWYLDQLGIASTYNTKVYCRQSLIGGNYGLLNTSTLAPNPDYYSALLWHRLMGKKVLGISSDISYPFLRTYAHCSKERAGVTLLLINLSNQTEFILNVKNHATVKANEVSKFREEYHLTPKDNNLRSQTMLLNGIPLKLTNKGGIPTMNPVHTNVKSPIYITPLSIAFIVYPNFDAPACARH